jgi:translation initiation factor IF-3
LKVNREIRALKVRVIGAEGEQIGVLSIYDALKKAEEAGLDLVEIAPNVVPPVCKIIDYGKFRYDQTKREKESKKAQHQIKVKEVKLKPHIDDNDLETKKRHARDFLVKGNKVKVTCTFRGREMVHTEIGEVLVDKFCEDLNEFADVEAPAKRMGRTITVILAPSTKKKKTAPVPAPA